MGSIATDVGDPLEVIYSAKPDHQIECIYQPGAVNFIVNGRLKWKREQEQVRQNVNMHPVFMVTGLKTEKNGLYGRRISTRETLEVTPFLLNPVMVRRIVTG